MVKNYLAPKPRSLIKLKPNTNAGSSAHGNVEGVSKGDVVHRWDDDAADAVGQLLEARGVQDVKAFALLTLHNGSDIAVRTSKNVREFAHSIASNALRQHLRQIYEDATDSAERGSEHSSQVSTKRSNTTTKLPVRTIQVRSDQGPGDEHPTDQLPVSRLRAQTAASDVDSDLSEVVKRDLAPVIRLRLRDTPNVKLQLEHRLWSLHQLPVKKIAKLWIKAICPKKQAKFPYQNKAYEDSTGLDPPVPKWWPDISVCAYTEPDHIHRDERVPLCVHLLRLRPSPEQLKIWNKDKPNAEPHPTHANIGWTAFLKEHAFAQLTDEDFRGGLPEQAARRRKLMEEMYEIAEREEFAMSADSGWGMLIIHDDDVMTVEDASIKIKKKTQMDRKRARANSMVKAGTPPESRSSSMVREPKQKKLRTAATREAITGARRLTNADAMDVIEGPSAYRSSRRSRLVAGPPPAHDSPAVANEFPYQTHGHDTTQLKYETFQPQYTDWPRSTLGLSDRQSTWANTISPNWSFNSTGSSESSFVPLSSIPGQYWYAPSMNSAQEHLQVNYAGHLPQPGWDTVPNTPMFSQATLTDLPPNPMTDLDRLADNGITPMNLDSQMSHGQGYMDPAVLNTDSFKYEPQGHDQVQHTDQSSYHDLLPLDHRQEYPGPEGTISQATPHGLPFQYPDVQAQTAFQAPARVTRPFTGHCSGVGGGACKPLYSRLAWEVAHANHVLGAL